MRFRHALTVAVLTVAGTLPLAGAAHAQPDRDCADFASQAEASPATTMGARTACPICQERFLLPWRGGLPVSPSRWRFPR